MALPTVAHEAVAAGRSQTLLAAALAAMLGVALLYVSGFAQPHALHDATHDSRHSFAFPCH